VKKSLGCFVIGGAIVLALIALGGYAVGRYTALITASENIDGAWAQVENVLQRRADLIPNLVETVKGFAAHERGIFEEIAEARSRLIGAVGGIAGSPEAAASANAALTSALSRLLAIVEAYPDLKANQNFIRLQDELAGTENRIAVERRAYNDAVREFNASIKRFPANLVARFFDFGEREYFEASPGAAETPKVEF
jgi:LemA protein